jgi:YfiH family protein
LLGILTADCVPILLASNEPLVVAAVHAGWRGAKAGIINATIEKMRALGANNITAAIGPCIWQQSYEVADDFYNNFDEAHQFFIKGNRSGHWYFDLPGYVHDQLSNAGVKNIDPSIADTYTCKDQFFSYRRKTHNPAENLAGNISIIGIKK